MAAGQEGRVAGSSAQQSLALLHPAVQWGPYNLQLKPFPGDQNSHTSCCWITLSLVMLQDGSYPSNQENPAQKDLYLLCTTTAHNREGAAQAWHPVCLSWATADESWRKRGQPESILTSLMFFKGEKKPAKEGQATTLQCSMFGN